MKRRRDTCREACATGEVLTEISTKRRCDEGVADSATMAAALSSCVQDESVETPEWSILKTWLESHDADVSKIEVRRFSGDAAVVGIGAFTRRALAPGEVAFAVPRASIMTPMAALEETSLADVMKFLQLRDDCNLSELILCLRLCHAFCDKRDFFHTYAASLPPVAQGASSWPRAHRDVLAETALRSSLLLADSELDGWMKLLEEAVSLHSLRLDPREAFTKDRLDWARSMVRSRHFPGVFAGDDVSQSGCLIPLLDTLNHRDGAPVTVKVHADRLEFICDEAVPLGHQVWNDYGTKTNAELLLNYGFALTNNPDDSVDLRLASSSKRSCVDAAVPGADLRLTRAGLPANLISSIKAGKRRGGALLVSLLRALALRRRSVQNCLERLPADRGCAGNLDGRRWGFLEIYLSGQNEIIECCLEDLQKIASPNKK
eukprot:TRINITY_DN37759_c0_g1_i1.p1 TRINITY_DN37759_c0_g1~~TRINITY_DN37759_c0_g1_i1.p1  ORF type:complete len:433 (+),score=59.10 TRINITY_DN37759_c0_g1_i1:68-1366(+)